MAACLAELVGELLETQALVEQLLEALIELFDVTLLVALKRLELGGETETLAAARRALLRRRHVSTSSSKNSFSL